MKAVVRHDDDGRAGLEVLQNHEVDMVARNMTITCDRWESIAFSAVGFGIRIALPSWAPPTLIDV